MEIRPCTATDVDVLETYICSGPSRHHQTRFNQQEAGDAIFLVAWHDDVPVGRLSLLVRSKYAGVNQCHPSLREVNALSVWPPEVRREGIATALMLEAERLTRNSGASLLGLSCDDDNEPARALYRRLGFERWPHGSVVDEWTSRDAAGIETCHSETCCYYLKELTATR